MQKIKTEHQSDGDLRYAPIAKGVTNGDSHGHNGGDGGTIAYSTLSGTPTVPTTEDIEDVVGAMVSGNTETGISVTYDDSGGKLNFDAQTAGDARYAPIANHAASGGRLTLTSGSPVTDTDVTGATTIYWSPDGDGSIELWDGSKWIPVIPGEISLALGTMTAGIGYDVFGYLSGGTMVMEKLAWSSATARATAVTIQDGRKCKSGDKTRRLLGAFYARSTTVTDDADGARFLSNMDNRRLRRLAVTDSNAHNYNVATVRAWNNNQAAADFEYFVGWVEDAITLNLTGQFLRVSTDGNPRISIAVNSTTTELGLFGIATTTLAARLRGGSSAVIMPSLGYSFACVVEFSTVGTAPGVSFESMALHGEILA